MLVHIVMFQFKEENKEANMSRVKEMLEALPSKIETLKSMEVGIDISRSERSFDLALISTFDDQAGLDIYAPHSAHQEVVSFIKEVTTLSKVVDYIK
ncbi:MAG: Dabb family protein [Sulfuricurvum sp.]|uniref:Dabb family protein n=1 Tax=Sulfuricurvum sp. TaxID=2025608 RepID=UPI00260FF685|nr:Dabb family protein [Sulfuricurvum sp.]MDD5158482.1 Dabb family protein [Sulfuricurvum sp.]